MVAQKGSESQEYKGLYINHIREVISGSDMYEVVEAKHSTTRLNRHLLTSLGQAFEFCDLIAAQRRLKNRLDEIAGNKKPTVTKHDAMYNDLRMVDMRNISHVQVRIDKDQKRLWVNTEYGCALRIYEADTIVVDIDPAEDGNSAENVVDGIPVNTIGSGRPKGGTA